MSQDYWNEAHVRKYSKASWAVKPSLFAKEVIRYFPAKGKVLDIGTGQGGDAAFFRSAGYEVIATDLSDEALKSASQRFEKVNFMRVDTAKGLPFADESFDVVYAHMSLHYFDEQATRSVFADVHRILKKNGIFATITNTMDDPEKEIGQYLQLEPGFYKDPNGIVKRYFSIASMRDVVSGLFEMILLDDKGETYKDDIKTLVRFVGKKK